MTATLGAPLNRAETLCHVIATEVPRLQGVAHLCAGWRDLAPHFTGTFGSRSRSVVHRRVGVEVVLDGATARVRVAIALQWPHHAQEVCRAVEVAVTHAAAEVVGTGSCRVHVAIRDVHFPPSGPCP
jgi:uncharacterized alkaline shock family protein YloU